jgi:hypothetical protein
VRGSFLQEPKLGTVLWYVCGMGSGLTVTCGDTEEDAVECLELGGVFDDRDGGVFSGSVHLVEDVLGQGLSDSEYTVSLGALVLPWRH